MSGQGGGGGGGGSAVGGAGQGSGGVSHEVGALVLSPAEDTLIASTVTNQLFHISLSGADFTRVSFTSNPYLYFCSSTVFNFVYQFNFLRRK